MNTIKSKEDHTYDQQNQQLKNAEIYKQHPHQEPITQQQSGHNETNEKNNNYVIAKDTPPLIQNQTTQEHEQNQKMVDQKQQQNEIVNKRQEISVIINHLEIVLSLRKHSFKLKTIKRDLQQKLINQISIVFSTIFYPQKLSQIFLTFRNLYIYLKKHITDNSRVKVDQDQIVILHPQKINKKQLQEDLYLNFDLLKEESAKKRQISIDLSNIEQKLLQFNGKELDILDSIDNFYMNGTNIEEIGSQKYSEFVEPFIKYVQDMDQQLFIEENALSDSEDDDFDFKKIEQEIQEKRLAIEEFKLFINQNQQLEQYLGKIAGAVNNSRQMQKISTGSNNNYNQRKQISSIFPAGYTPPHLAKAVIAANGSTLTPLAQYRVQANATKKQKLKMAKQMLKSGMSVAEVIQRLQAQDRSGNNSSQKSVTNYMQPRAPVGRPPMQPIYQQRPQIPQQIPQMQQQQNRQNQQSQQMNSHNMKVKQMLITLLKQKRYKKLDDIQKHMANQGLQTTVQVLKKMVDDIRTRNNQRKQQQQE